MRAAALALALALAACATPPLPPPVAEVQAPPPAPVAAAPEEPPLPADPVARGRALVEAWRKAPWDDQDRWAEVARESSASEPELRALIQHFARACLDEKDRGGPECKALTHGSAQATEILPSLLDLLAELADPALHASPAQRLLARLDQRGLWTAERALSRLLARRAAPACAAPGAAEIDAARRSLGDFAIAGAPPRWPTPAELDDLAYLQAVVAEAGAAVGSFAEDGSGRPLPEGHPDLAAREALDAEMKTALLDGDVTRHLRAAEAYLRSLGYPARLRMMEEGSGHWGGAHASYVMRDAARSAEILGRDELAEALYRRANPGGGMCGTSVESVRADQLRGAIRASTRARGCRAAAGDLLYGLDERDRTYGPQRLAAAGFDVPRLYRAALLTVGRDDPAALRASFAALPARAAEAEARVERLGPEAWATRLRAIPGFADTTRGASLDRLLELAERGPTTTARVEAMDALSHLAHDHGWDPCVPSRHGRGFGSSGNGGREVATVMDKCETRLAPRVVEDAVRRVSLLAKDPEPRVRKAVAEALGRLGSPRGRPALKLLAADTFDAGGRVCSSKNGGPQVCEPNRPVARAAREAQEHLAEADKTRAEQRAGR